MAERRNAFPLTVFEVEASCVIKNEIYKEMSQQYEEYMPTGGLSPEWEDMSYFTDDDAILYTNGENVHVWRIITV